MNKLKNSLSIGVLALVFFSCEPEPLPVQGNQMEIQDDTIVADDAEEYEDRYGNGD
tara:strand:- start:309 stop:476 length:168 start_codon:yes stop_codon:yes gene_type:complete